MKALTALIEVSPESITDCQMTVVELLDDPDQAIQSKVSEYFLTRTLLRVQHLMP